MIGLKGVLLAGLVGFAGWVLAAEDTHSDARDWKSSVYGGFNLKSGNTVEQTYRVGGDFEKKNGSLYQYMLKVDGRYRKTNRRVSESKAEASGEMRRLMGDRWFVSGRLSALHDDQKSLAYRVKTGPGIGRYLVDSDALTTDVSTGLLYTEEKSAGQRSNYIAWRISQRLNWQVTETLTAWVITECFMNTSDMADYQISFQAGAETRINNHLSLMVGVDDEYDNAPYQRRKIEKNDLEVNTGLRYRF